MDIRELRYFLAVADEQNITKAAERLYISQPSLSKQMSNLEEEIGAPLFIRGGRKITLTESGILLKKRAEELMDLYDKTRCELMSHEKEISGTVYIGGGESRAMSVTAAAAKKVMTDYPRIKFDFFSGDAQSVTEKLEKGLLDFAVLVDGDTSPYESLRLPYGDTWGLLVRKDSPVGAKNSVSVREARKLPLIVSRQGTSQGGILRRLFGGDTDALNIKAVYNLVYNASLLVNEGIGCAVGIDGIINTSGNGSLKFVPFEPAVKTYLDVMWKKRQVFGKAAVVFLKYLKAEINEIK